MSKQFIRLAADIVIANSTGKGFTTEQLTHMLQAVTETLERLATEPRAAVMAETHPARAEAPADWQSSITRNAITCLICGYRGKLLTPHLKSKHQMTPQEYRRKFAIPARTPLVSKAYRAKRSKIAKETGGGEKLTQARRAKKTTT